VDSFRAFNAVLTLSKTPSGTQICGWGDLFNIKMKLLAQILFNKYLSLAMVPVWHTTTFGLDAHRLFDIDIVEGAEEDEQDLIRSLPRQLDAG